MRAPGSKFFQFHAVFGKIWQNRILAPPGSWRPFHREILDPPLTMDAVSRAGIAESVDCLPGLKL